MLFRNCLVALAGATLLAVLTGTARAERVTFELVSARQPDKLVSDLVKSSESGYGGFVATDWGRCFTVDGRHLFVTETMRIGLQETGKNDEKRRALEAGAKENEEFKAKEPLRDQRGDIKVESRASLDLPDGFHTIEPGMHRFVLKGEEIRTDDPALRVKGTTITIPCPLVKVFSTEGEKHPQWVPQKVQAFYRNQHLLEGTSFRRLIPAHRAYFEWDTGPETNFLFLNLFLVPNPKADETVPYQIFGRNVWVSQEGIQIDDETAVDPLRRTELVVDKENPSWLVMRRAVGSDPVRRIGFSYVRGQGDDTPFLYLSGESVDRGRGFTIVQPTPDVNTTYKARIRSRSATPVTFEWPIRGDFGSFPYRASVLDSSGPPKLPDRFLLAELSGAVISPNTPVKARLNVYPKTGRHAVGKVSFSAVLRPRGGQGRELPVELTQIGKSSDLFALKAPELEQPGQYDLVVTCHAERDVPLTMPVLGVPSQGAGSVTLFTDGNRNTYFQDEPVEVNVCVRSPKPVPAGELLVLLDGKEAMRHSLKPFPPGRTTRSFIMDASRLKPGKYTFTARLGNLNVYDLPILISDATERTEYSSLTTGNQCGTSVSNPDFPTRCHIAEISEAARVKGFNAPALVESIRKAYAVADSRFSPRLLNLVGESADAPVLEKTLSPPWIEKTLSKFTADRVRVFPAVLGCEVDGFAMLHTLKIDNEVMTRLVQMYAQQVRKYAAVEGLVYSFFPSNGWKPMDIDGVSEVPQYRFKLRLNKVRENFRAAGGVMPRHTRELREELAKDPEHRDQNVLDKYRDQVLAWERFRCEIYPTAFKLWQDGIRKFEPGWKGMAGPRGHWTHNGGYVPPDFYRELDVASVSNVHDYEETPFMLPFSVDYGGAGIHDKPIWLYSTQNSSRPAEVRNTFQCLAAGAKGIAYSRGFEPDYGSDNSIPGHNEYHRWLLDFLNRYGPYFRTLKPRKEVAILASRTQDSIEGGNYNTHKKRIWGCYQDLWYLGYHPDIVLERDIAAGRLSDYRVLFVIGVGWRLEPEVMAGIERFRKAGGRVFRDDSTCEAFGGASLGMAYGATRGVRGGLDGTIEWERALKGYLQVRGPLLKATRGVVHPVATYDSPYLMAGTMIGPDSLCLLVVNNTPPPVGPRKYLKEYAIPARERIYLDREYAVYDMLDNERVRLAKDERGYGFVADFNRVEGRAYCLLERPIDSLRVETVREARAGQRIPVRAWLSDSKGAKKGSFPMSVSLLGPDGAAGNEYYRALNPERTFKVLIPENGQAGAWTLRVRDLITGLVADAPLRVSPATEVERIRPAGEVFVVGEDRVRQFLKEKASVQIVLDTRERNLMPEAKHLASLLKNAGLQVRVRVHEPETTPLVWLRWIRTAADEKLWNKLWSGELIGIRRNLGTYVDIKQDCHFGREQSGYREPGPLHIAMSDMIILGAPLTNLILKDIHEAEIAPRRVTENFPGPGQAIVQRVWSPFYNDYDALMVESPDREGIAKAVKALGRMLKSPTKRAPTETPPAWKNLRKITATQPMPLRFCSDRCGNAIADIAYSPDGSELIVGANFYGSNLFCLDAGGNVKWHRHAAHVRIEDVGVSERGITVGAGFSTTDRGDLGRFRARKLVLDRKGQVQWNAPVGRLAWTPDGKNMATGSEHLVVCYDAAGNILWHYDDSARWTTYDDLRARRRVWPIAFSPDGKHLLCGALGIIPDYKTNPSRTHRPAALLLDASDGSLLWEKRFRVNRATFTERGVLVDGDRIAMYSLDGKRLFSAPLSRSCRKALVSNDKQLVAYQTNWRVTPVRKAPSGQCGPVEILQPGATPLRLSTEGEVRDFDISPDSEHISVGTWRNMVHVFDKNGTEIWQRPVKGGAVVRFSPDGSTLVAGTSLGALYFFSRDGKLKRKLDLMDYNMRGDVAGGLTARSYPLKEFQVPMTHMPGTARARVAGQLGLDRNALPDGSFEKGPGAWSFDKTARIRDEGYNSSKSIQIADGVSRTFDVLPDSDYLLSWFYKRELLDPATEVAIRIVKAAPEQEVLYEGKVGAPEVWDDMVLAFKTRSARKVTLHLKSIPANAGVLMDDVQVSRIRYPSRNYLKTEDLDITKGFDLAAKGRGELAAKHREKFLKVTMTVPNTNHFFAVDFLTPVMPAQQFTDGVVFGQDSSWMKQNFSSALYSKGWLRARKSEAARKRGRSGVKFRLKGGWVDLKLAAPKELSCIVIYEEAGGMLRQGVFGGTSRVVSTPSRDMLVRVKDAATGRWKSVGIRVDNRHVVNFYTFKPTKVSHISYYIARSYDNHVRTMEIEAYGPAVANIEDEILEKSPDKKKPAEPPSPGFDLGL